MLFYTHGKKDKPIIMLLHGGGLSAWSWRPVVEALKSEFCIITPIIDGHGEDSDTPFTTIEKCAEQIVDHVQRYHGGRIHTLCGLSIGAQIVVDTLAKSPNIAKYAVIESALLYPMPTTSACIVPMYNLCYGLIKKRWYAKLQAKTLNITDEVFEHYYKDSSRMTKESLINITKSNASYSLPSSIGLCSAKMLVLVGEREIPIMKRSAKALHDAVPGSRLEILKGYGHGEISQNHPKEYIDLIKQIHK